MADTFCVCNMGTWGDRAKENHVLVKLYGKLEGIEGGQKWINDGPGSGKAKPWYDPTGLLGGVMGAGIEKNLDATIPVIKESGAKRVFILGHSRGAITSYLIANRLHEANTGQEVHIFNVDPVAMTTKSGRDIIAPNVKSIRAIVMENDTSKIFPLTFAQPEIQGTVKPEYIVMPGKHGTATIVEDWNPVGRIAYELMIRWLKENAVKLAGIESKTDKQISEMFFEIHERNPVQWEQKRTTKRDWKKLWLGSKTLESHLTGRVAAREIHGGKSGEKVKALEVAPRRKMLSSSGVENYLLDSPLFINALHMKLFIKSWPTVFRALLSGNCKMITPEEQKLYLELGLGAPVKTAKGAFKKEVAEMKANIYTMMRFRKLGILE